MDVQKEIQIANVLKNDVVIQSVHDVRSTMLGLPPSRSYTYNLFTPVHPLNEILLP